MQKKNCLYQNIQGYMYFLINLLSTSLTLVLIELTRLQSALARDRAAREWNALFKATFSDPMDQSHTYPETIPDHPFTY